MAALRAWQGSALEGPSRRVLAASADGLARLLRYLPALSAPAGWARVYPAHGAARAEVALFLGCVARELDGRTITAAIRVLARLGYTVRVPAGQGCCGAIYLHDGEEAAALEQVRRNLRAFAESPKGPIVSVTSGCAATLAEYAHLRGLEPGLRQGAAEFSARVYEVTDLLAREPWPESVRLAPLAARVAVHEPCSARNVLRCAPAPYEVLGRIPGVDLVALPGNEFCCGAAGAYMVTQPQMADRLREGKLNSIAATGAATIVTVNLGCALHLSAGRLHGGPMPEVVHPLVLLDRQVADSPPLVPAGSQFKDTDTP